MGDGAKEIRNLAFLPFPGAILIVDIYHGPAQSEALRQALSKMAGFRSRFLFGNGRLTEGQTLPQQLFQPHGLIGFFVAVFNDDGRVEGDP